MTEATDAARRGRREATMDASLPAHRVAFAARLRDLRQECGQPTYRVMSELAHCSFASLSGAAAGKRFPTWETTRGYVIACLRHAGRAAEVDLVLPGWRRAWADASLLEKADRISPAPAPVPAPAQPVPPRRRPLLWKPVLSVLALLLTMAGAAAPVGPAPMTGIYNILLVPFKGYPGLESTLAREMDQWAGAEPILQTRGPAGVEQSRDLERLAGIHHADVVLTGRLDPSGDRLTVVVEMLVTERVFAETPEFVGRHEFTLTEPADVVRGNIELSQAIAGDAVSYVQAVVSFVRGLGRYALDDYVGAERYFQEADADLYTLAKARAPQVATRSEVVLLMLGNAAGRAGRHAEAAATFRRALEQRPGYARATVGLAEALRADGCRRGDTAAMHQALELYRTALTEERDALLELKTRLGLGLTYQCLSVTGTPRWTEADGQYTAVLRKQAAAGLTGELGRQAQRLAAEARAGQALTAWKQGRLEVAATGYEEAIGRLHRIGVQRATINDRELAFLRNLRDVHRENDDTAQVAEVDRRIRRAGGRP